MTAVELERPVPEAPQVRDWFSLADVALRTLALTVLLVAGLSVVPAHRAVYAPSSTFSRDLQSHRVTQAVYDEQSRTLRWSDGWLHWYAAQLASERASVTPRTDGGGTVTVESDGSADNSVDLAWLREVQDQAGTRLNVEQVSAGDHLAWMLRIPSALLKNAAVAALAPSFVLMLGRGRRRFANRWGWLWVFLLGGAVGAAAFLVLEPFLLWRRSRVGPLVPERPAHGGGYGLLAGFAVKAGISVAGGVLTACHL